MQVILTLEKLLNKNLNKSYVLIVFVCMSVYLRGTPSFTVRHDDQTIIPPCGYSKVLLKFYILDMVPSRIR